MAEYLTDDGFPQDRVVAEERSSFGLPEVKRGLIAAAGGVFRIVDHLPRKVVENFFLAEVINVVVIQQVEYDVIFQPFFLFASGGFEVELFVGA